MDLGSDEEFNKRNSFYADRYNYTKDTCLDTCRQMTIVHRIGCCVPSLPCNPLGLAEIFGVQIPRNLTYCPTSEYDKNTTAAELIENLNLLPSHCEYRCPEPCQTISYHYTATFLEFPVEGNMFERNYFRQHGHSLGLQDNASSREIHEAIRSEVLKFEVDLESLEVDMTTIKTKYNLCDLFANIGGALSLYSGISIISQVVIFQLVIDLLIQLWLKTRNRQSSTRVGSEIQPAELLSREETEESGGKGGRFDEDIHQRFSFRRENAVL